MHKFDPKQLSKLFKPDINSTKGDNGQVTIIGGSTLFHGAPLFALTTASRICDMVFFGSPDSSVGEVANQIKSKLFSFIWIPWSDLDSYIEKSDACLIGPGMMRFGSEKLKGDSEKFDDEGKRTKEITRQMLNKFQHKKWVIDAGSLQTMEVGWIPNNSILTPNQKEYRQLFNSELPARNITHSVAGGQILNDKFLEQSIRNASENAKKYKCVIVLKGPKTVVVSENEIMEIPGGNPGLTKGGSGDVEAGLTVALMAKNDPFFSACAASFIVKHAADKLYLEVGSNYNSDDLARKIPEILFNYSKQN